MTTTEAARIAAAGVPLVLANGRTVNLRFGFRGLVALEDEFGGIAAVEHAISGDMTSATLRPLAKALACGLGGEHDGAGAPLTADRLINDELLAPTDLKSYADAFQAALTQAFPPPAAAAEESGTATAEDSRGATGTTSAPSPSDAPTPSSG